MPTAIRYWALCCALVWASAGLADVTVSLMPNGIDGVITHIRGSGTTSGSVAATESDFTDIGDYTDAETNAILFAPIQFAPGISVVELDIDHDNKPAFPDDPDDFGLVFNAAVPVGTSFSLNGNQNTGVSGLSYSSLFPGIYSAPTEVVGVGTGTVVIYDDEPVDRSFSGTVEQVLIPDYFGGDVQVGDPIEVVMTFGAPNGIGDIFEFVDGVSGELLFYFFGLANNASQIQADIGNTSISCGGPGTANAVVVADDFISSTNPNFTVPGDLVSTNFSDGFSSSGAVGDCVDVRFDVVFFDPTGDMLDDANFAIPETEQGWDMATWQLVTPNPITGDGMQIVSGSFGPVTPVEALEDLAENVAAIELPSGIETSLTSVLNNAQKKLAVDDSPAAAGMLRAFINKVNAKRGKQISQEEADQLIGDAEAIASGL